MEPVAHPHLRPDMMPLMVTDKQAMARLADVPVALTVSTLQVTAGLDKASGRKDMVPKVLVVKVLALRVSLDRASARKVLAARMAAKGIKSQALHPD